MSKHKIKMDNFKKIGFCEHEKPPCWFVEIKKSAKLEKTAWRYGCKFGGKTEEHYFEINRLGDVTSELLNRFISYDFATEILDLYMEGGFEAVDKWVDFGCP